MITAKKKFWNFNKRIRVEIPNQAKIAKYNASQKFFLANVRYIRAKTVLPALITGMTVVA